jgi:hypothetical protein
MCNSCKRRFLKHSSSVRTLQACADAYNQNKIVRLLNFAPLAKVYVELSEYIVLYTILYWDGIDESTISLIFLGITMRCLIYEQT